MANVRRGDEAAVRESLAHSPKLVSAFDSESFGATPLIHAVVAENRAMVDLLLGAGADINQRSDWWAGSFGVLDHGNDAICAYLLERGATLTPHAAGRLGMIGELREMLEQEPGRVHELGGDGQTPLHFARTVEIAEFLLSEGAEMGARDIDHESTAAEWCVPSRLEVAAYLVRQGYEADPFMAAMIGDLELLESVVAREAEGVHVRITQDRFPTKGAKAAHHIYFYTIGQDATLVHAAANANQGKIIRWLSKNGCDPNARCGYDDHTALHAAGWHDAVGATEALIDGGADINARSGKIHENEPLGWAIVSGAANVVETLINRGARVRDIHREDADAGVNGEFQEYNRGRPAEKWIEIRDILASHPEHD